MAQEKRKVDIVWVDDQLNFVEGLINRCFKNAIIDKYCNPLEFIQNLSQYSKDTAIFLDTGYEKAETYDITGFTLAEKLHKMGYTNLFLIAGREIEPYEMLDYLPVILKNDLNTLRKLGNKLIKCKSLF